MNTVAYGTVLNIMLEKYLLCLVRFTMSLGKQ